MKGDWRSKSLEPLHCEVSGSGSPPVVLIHGFGAYGAFWNRWLPGLTARHRCYVVDLPGFGRSAVGNDPSPLGQATAVADFILRDFTEPPVLIGHSLGGGVAVFAALRIAEAAGWDALAGLVLVSGAVHPQRFPPYIERARTRGIGEIFLLATPPRWAVRRGLRGIVHDPSTVDDGLIEIQRLPYRSRERRAALIRAARAIDPHAADGISAKLATIELPTLLLWGKEDSVVPLAMGERLAGEIPGARLTTLPGVGHLPPVEAPDASLAPVLDFLAGFRR